MDSMSLLKVYNLISDSNSNIHDFEVNMVESVNDIKFGNAVTLPAIDKKFIPNEYIISQLGVLDAVSDRVPELEEFYTSIYTNDDFQKSPSATTPVFDINEIKDFRPQYLVQFTKQVAKNIQDIIDGRFNKSNISEMTDSEKMLKSLKKNLVSSNMPEYVKDNNFIRFDNKLVVPVNSSYIQTTLLPFLRGIYLEKKNFEKTAEKLINTISSCVDTMNDYNVTLTSLIKRGDIENPTLAASYINSASMIFMKASKHMIGCFMRKVYIYTSNIKEYGTLKDQLMLSFNNGADVLHEAVLESVLDGSYEFRDEDIVLDMLNGRSDLFESIIDRVYNKFKDYLLELKGQKIGDSLHSLIDLEIENSGFDLQLYKEMLSVEAKLADSVEKLANLSRDSLLSIEDIEKQSGLSDKLHHLYGEVFQKMSNIDMYITDQNYDSCISILNELQYGKKFMSKFSSNMESIYAIFSDLKKDISINDNDEFENHERNKEELVFLDSFDKDLRQFILDLSRTYMSRLRNLEDTLIENDSQLSCMSPNSKDVEQTDDYLCRALEENLDIDSGYMESVLTAMYNEIEEKVMFESTRSPMISIFLEADDNAQQNDNNQNNGNNQNNNNDKNSTKPTVNDGGDTNNTNNANGNDSSNNNNGNDQNGQKTGIKGIIEKITNFILGIVDKIKKLISDLVNKGHLKFIENNKDALLKRSYSNVQINILPYTETDYIKFIDDCNTQMGSFKSNPANMKEKDVDNKMFRGTPLNKTDKSLKMNERLNIALKSNTGKLTTVPISNGELATLIPKMIDYCEDYYKNFGNNFESSVNKLKATLDQITQNASNIENAKDPDGVASSKILQHMGTNVNTIIGVVANVARDRARDYYDVLHQLVPKNKKTEDNSDQNKSNDQNNDNTNEDQNNK